MAVYSVNNSNNRFTLKLTLTEGTPDVNNNCTPITYLLQLVANTAYNFSTYAIGSSIYLDGKQVHYQERTTAKQYSIADYGTLDLASGTVNITHSTDGTKSMGVSFSIDMKAVEYTPGALSYSTTMTLTTIKRATTPVLSSPSPTMCSNLTITLPRASTSFTHTLRCIFGNSNILIGQGITTSSTWFIPIDLADEIPNAPSGIGVIECETFNNGVSLGKKQTALSISVPDDYNAKPTLTMALTPVDNASWVTSGTYIQSKSKVKAVITGSGKHKATILSYGVSMDNKSQTGTTNTFTTDVITTSGTVAVVGTVKDSREFTSEPLTQNITVYPYGLPSIVTHTQFGEIAVARCTSSGILAEDGTHLKVRLRKKWYSLSKGENTATLTCLVEGTSYSSGSITLSPATEASGGGASNNYMSWYDVDEIVSGVTLDIAKAYTVTINVTDRYGTSATPLVVKIPTSRVDFHLRRYGKGAAFGEYAEEENVVSIASTMKLKAKGNAEVGGALTVSGNASANTITSKGSTVNGNSSVTGNESIGGTLSVTGTATVGGLKVGSNTPVDFVIEQGTSGIWTYEKRSSGKVELCGVYSFNLNKPAGDSYALTEALSYPFTLMGIYDFQISNAGGYLVNFKINSVTQNSCSFIYWTHGDVGVVGVPQDLYINIKGRWK